MAPGIKVLCAVILALSVAYVLAQPRTMVREDGRLVKNSPGRAEVAAFLARLEDRVRAFLRDAPPDEDRIKRIKERWTGSLAEIDPDAEAQGSLAYSLDKGTIHLCVRAPDGSLADENTAMFVLIHELAHVASHSWQHTPEFWANMKYLLQLADSLGHYTYTHHGQETVTLCGRVLGPSPLTCVREKTCAPAL